MSKTGEMIKKPRLGIFLELWAMMMGLVLLTVGCMWFGQVLFLEKNYADATLASPDGSPDRNLQQWKGLDRRFQRTGVSSMGDQALPGGAGNHPKQEPFQKLHTKDQRIDAILMPFSRHLRGADAFLVSLTGWT